MDVEGIASGYEVGKNATECWTEVGLDAGVAVGCVGEQEQAIQAEAVEWDAGVLETVLAVMTEVS